MAKKRNLVVFCCVILGLGVSVECAVPAIPGPVDVAQSLAKAPAVATVLREKGNDLWKRARAKVFATHAEVAKIGWTMFLGKSVVTPLVNWVALWRAPKKYIPEVVAAQHPLLMATKVLADDVEERRRQKKINEALDMLTKRSERREKILLPHVPPEKLPEILFQLQQTDYRESSGVNTMVKKKFDPQWSREFLSKLHLYDMTPVLEYAPNVIRGEKKSHKIVNKKIAQASPAQNVPTESVIEGDANQHVPAVQTSEKKSSEQQEQKFEGGRKSSHLAAKCAVLALGYYVGHRKGAKDGLLGNPLIKNGNVKKNLMEHGILPQIYFAPESGKPGLADKLSEVTQERDALCELLVESAKKNVRTSGRDIINYL